MLNGQKRLIGNAIGCDVSVIWARYVADNRVKAFLIENKTTPGFSVEKIQRNKIALKRRAKRPDHDEGLPRSRGKPPATR